MQIFKDAEYLVYFYSLMDLDSHIKSTWNTSFRYKIKSNRLLYKSWTWCVLVPTIAFNVNEDEIGDIIDLRKVRSCKGRSFSTT